MSALAATLLAELDDRALDELANRLRPRLAVQQTTSPWLTSSEAADRLRCGTDRIYDLIALGKLVPRRDGRRVLLHRDDLDAYVEGRTS